MSALLHLTQYQIWNQLEVKVICQTSNNREKIQSSYESLNCKQRLTWLSDSSNRVLGIYIVVLFIRSICPSGGKESFWMQRFMITYVIS